MGLTWGVHTGLQNTTVDELKDLWHRIEDLRLRLDLDLGPLLRRRPRGTHCLEAVAAHTALACSTERVRVRLARLLRRLPPPRGAGQRHRHHRPPVGRPGRARARCGLGRQASTRPTASPSRRRASGSTCWRSAVQCVRGLLRDERTDFDGEHFTLTDAACEPEAGAGRAARSGSAAAARSGPSHRGPVRRRVERAVRRPPRCSPTSAACCAEHCADDRPRPRRDPLRRQRRAWPPTTTGSGAQFGGMADVRPARCARRLPRRDGRPDRRPSSRPAPTRSTWPSGRRGTSGVLDTLAEARDRFGA